MRKIFIIVLLAWTFNAQALTDRELAVRNIERAIDIADATWEKCMIGTPDNMYMADSYDTANGNVSGPSDVWPLTAAIEAHCSILEAVMAAHNSSPDLYASYFEIYTTRLGILIDNLDYYRGTYRLPSYASNRQWSPFAVPRSAKRNEANVTGILNVYDDQMWLSRELIRAYRITKEDRYLDLATYLAEYVIDGWDCWRDSDGNEYGGITWGPGYNSKHSCSNGPIIQPLVWLAQIYDGTGEETTYYYRDAKNDVRQETRLRSELYLEFARKVYDWQKAKLGNGSGVYWDMMGAVTGEIEVSRGYRRHVDSGAPGGTFYSYNTGTMLGGGAELYKVTGDKSLKKDIDLTSSAAFSTFARYVRKPGVYVFNTDKNAMEGFNTWFNDVLLRAYVDAEPFADGNVAKRAIDNHQKCLDYAFENHNRGNMLPIHLIDGWGEETRTKGFHQFTFASEYALLARRLLESEAVSAITLTTVDYTKEDDSVFSLGGIYCGKYSEIKSFLPAGYYVVNRNKIFIK